MKLVIRAKWERKNTTEQSLWLEDKIVHCKGINVLIGNHWIVRFLSFLILFLCLSFGRSIGREMISLFLSPRVCVCVSEWSYSQPHTHLGTGNFIFFYILALQVCICGRSLRTMYSSEIVVVIIWLAPYVVDLILKDWLC